MQVFLDESHRKHFGAALKKTSSGGSENMEKTDFCTSPIIIALVWILCCLFVLATMSVKHHSKRCAFLIRPFLTVTRQPTSWRTWSQTRPMMCLSPPSIRTNRRARICWALRGHVRCTPQWWQLNSLYSNTVLLKLLNRIFVGSWRKARIMINLLILPSGNMLSEMFSEGYAHHTFLFLPL